jgi:hypothetical protein
VNVLVSVDPGLKGCGVAAFRDGRLEAATYIAGRPTPGVLAQAQATSRAVVEWCYSFNSSVLAVEFPQVYRQRLGADPNDLLGLAAVLGGLNPLSGSLIQFSPHDWKGSIDGDVMIERIKGLLTAEEARAVELPPQRALQHNVFDGIGIGMHALSRLSRKRVIAR